jgi:hypothetical protein
MTLGSTQPLTEMSSGGRCVGLTTLPPSHADCLEILGASTLCSRKGLSRPVMGYLYHYLMWHIIQENTCRWQYSAGWQWSLVRSKDSDTADEKGRGCYGCALYNGHVANPQGILLRGLEIVNFKERRDWNIISKWIFQIFQVVLLYVVIIMFMSLKVLYGLFSTSSFKTLQITMVTVRTLYSIWTELHAAESFLRSEQVLV